MKDLEGQNFCLKICFKLGKTFTQTLQMLQQAYREDCWSRTQCYEWYQRFKSGRTSIEDDPKSGRHSSSTGEDHIEKMRSVIREVSEEVGIYKSACHTILTEKRKMHRVAAKFVPRLLTEEQNRTASK